MKKNKISRKEKIVNDISNYFFIYGYEEGINNYDNENKNIFGISLIII